MHPPMSWAECHAAGMTCREAFETLGKTDAAARAWARRHGVEWEPYCPPLMSMQDFRSFAVKIQRKAAQLRAKGLDGFQVSRQLQKVKP